MRACGQRGKEGGRREGGRKKEGRREEEEVGEERERERGDGRIISAFM